MRVRLGDGSVCFFPDSIALTTWQNLGKPSGGDVVAASQI